MNKISKWKCKSVSFRDVCHIYKHYVANGSGSYNGDLCAGCLWSEEQEVLHDNR